MKTLNNTLNFSAFFQKYHIVLANTGGASFLQFNLGAMLNRKFGSGTYDLLLAASQQNNLKKDDPTYWLCGMDDETIILPDAQVEKHPSGVGFSVVDFKGNTLHLLGYKRQEVFLIDVMEDIPDEFYIDNDSDGELDFSKIALLLSTDYKQGKKLPACVDVQTTSQLYHGINHAEISTDHTYIVPLLD